MKTNAAIAYFSLAVLPMAVSARADDKQAPGPSQHQRAPEYCLLKDIVGAKVSMTPSAEAVREASKEGESADRPVGKVDDLLFDCCDGSLSWAVVTFDKTLGFGGTCVAIPCDQLTWNADLKCFDLHQTEAQLKSLPNFKLEDAKKTGVDKCCSDLVALWPNSRVGAHMAKHTANSDAAKREAQAPITIDGKAYRAATPQLMVASDVCGTTVYGRGEKFGKIANCIVDRANHEVRYFVVSHGGTLGIGETEFLIPALATCVHVNGNESIHNVDRSVKLLESAVKYEKPENGVVEPTAAQRADDMFADDIKKRCELIRQ